MYMLSFFLMSLEEFLNYITIALDFFWQRDEHKKKYRHTK
jgi:hypothetical protein